MVEVEEIPMVDVLYIVFIIVLKRAERKSKLLLTMDRDWETRL